MIAALLLYHLGHMRGGGPVKLRRLISLALVVVSLAVFAAPVGATQSGDEYQWVSSTRTWKDIHCDGSQTWEVHLYQDVQYGGNNVRICSNTSTFCEVPLSNNGATGCTLFGTDSLNDEATSVIWHTYAGFTSTCIAIRSNTNYSGAYLRLPPGSGAIPNMGPYNIGNDSASSVSHTSPATCVPA